ncbi:MAG: MerR family transcriptional regulator [Beijerinckiaceae bacterium]|nr:MerR family transcriptional regulator [Beijerinckiaceae bacterium]
MDRPADAFRTISEVADELDLPQHVLRFWETKFTQIRPLKRGGGRRYYRPDDVELLRAIRHLLYGEGYTIRGVQRILKEQGVKAVISLRVEGGSPVIGRPAVSPPDDAEDDDVEVAPLDGAARRQGAYLAAGSDSRLRAVLDELAECSRILEAARAT